ncbi:MAG: BON domain-containing protein [Pseudomonadota bacterium]|nr:BON domain-containing protein [Pseudomonadota bacterium]
MNTSFRKTLIASAIALSSFGVAGTAFAADTVGQDVTEARQETQIWTTYALSPHLRANDLKVSVDNGKATLSGTVEEGVNKDLAKQIALGVNGITSVDNQIVVQPEYVAAPSSDRRYGEVIDDATITSSVKSKLMWSKYTDGLTTDVDTNRGNVKLTGTADSEAAKKLASQLTANTRGVVSVNNQLVVTAPKETVGDKTKAASKEAVEDVADGWISTKVKSTLLYSSNVDGSDIKVDTKNGVVTLSGTVDNGAERALAIELAKNVRGVKSVQSKGLKI